MNNNVPKIVIAEASTIVRSGLTMVLKRLPNLNLHPTEVTTREALRHYIELHSPNIVIVNPSFGGWFDLAAFRNDYKEKDIKYVALICNIMDKHTLKSYNEMFSLYDDTEVIGKKIALLLQTEEDEEDKDNAEILSQREKEIITCVVKGMTNKAIADKLYLSIHTIITHRRNIARKLQIHSPAGLTIYAIVNKLVELNDIKYNL